MTADIHDMVRGLFSENPEIFAEFPERDDDFIPQDDGGTKPLKTKVSLNDSDDQGQQITEKPKEGGDNQESEPVEFKILRAVRSRRRDPISEIGQATAVVKFRCTDGLEVVERNGFVAVGRLNNLNVIEEIPSGVNRDTIDEFIDDAGSPWVRIPKVLTIGWEVVKSLDRDVVTLRPYFHAVKAQQDKHPDDDMLTEMHRQMLEAFNLEPIRDVPLQEITG